MKGRRPREDAQDPTVVNYWSRFGGAGIPAALDSALAVTRGVQLSPQKTYWGGWKAKAFEVPSGSFLSLRTSGSSSLLKVSDNREGVTWQEQGGCLCSTARRLRGHVGPGAPRGEVYEAGHWGCTVKGGGVGKARVCTVGLAVREGYCSCVADQAAAHVQGLAGNLRLPWLAGSSVSHPAYHPGMPPAPCRVEGTRSDHGLSLQCTSHGF